MPRQPYLKVVSNPQRKALLDFNLNTTSDRPELHALGGDCLLAWPYVEAEMAVVLAELLRAENEPAVAVFQTIRRSSAQRDWISVATLASHDQQATELVRAILNITKSVEASRNALAHGHFGISDEVPDGLIWAESIDYVKRRTNVSIKGDRFNEKFYRQILESVYIYRKIDLTVISRDINDLYEIWFALMEYLQSGRRNSETTSELYRQLCDRSRVAQELARVRQKNTPSVPSQ
jgi:hypothetical protein